MRPTRQYLTFVYMTERYCEVSDPGGSSHRASTQQINYFHRINSYYVAAINTEWKWEAGR